MAEDNYTYATWRAEWGGGLMADVTGRGHTIRADEPPEFDGTDTGPMPTEILAAALASCLCLSVAWAARKRRVEITDLAIEVTPHRAPGEPRHGRYDIRIESSTPQDVLQPVVDLGKKYCWVTNTLTTPPEMTYTVVSVGP